MGIQDIRSAIKTKLDTLKVVWKPLAFVYDYFTTKAEWYPVAMFEPVDLTSETDNTCENKRDYQFRIFVLQEMTIKTREEAINLVLDSFQEIIDAFDKDWTLWGEVLEVKPVPWSFGQWEQEKWDVYYASIDIVCMVLYNHKI